MLLECCAVDDVGMWCYREETEIIEGEVVEIQIDRPATGTVCILVYAVSYHASSAGHHIYTR